MKFRGYNFSRKLRGAILVSAKQNITLSLEKDLLRRARAMAAGQGMSISALLAEGLRQMADNSEHYSRCQREALAMMATGFHLGGQGLGDREGLHDRDALR